MCRSVNQRELDDQRCRRAEERERLERLRGVHNSPDCLHDPVCREVASPRPER